MHEYSPRVLRFFSAGIRLKIAFFEGIRSLLVPSFCCCCGSSVAYCELVCASCHGCVQPVATAQLTITRKRQVKVFAACAYEDPLRRLILAKRHSRIVASRQLGHVIWHMTDVQHVPFDCVIPIPLHWSRHARRGYNQAAEMARVVAQKSSKSMVLSLIRRGRKPFQSRMANTSERTENVRDMFVVPARKIKKINGAHVLLVDDLMASGATLTAAARVLYRAGAAQVTAVVACRTI